MNIELSRFRVKAGKTEKVDECIDNESQVDMKMEVSMIPHHINNEMNN